MGVTNARMGLSTSVQAGWPVSIEISPVGGQSRDCKESDIFDCEVSIWSRPAIKEQAVEPRASGRSGADLADTQTFLTEHILETAQLIACMYNHAYECRLTFSPVLI